MVNLYYKSCKFYYYYFLLQGWLELASARQSMGSSRVSSALFNLKYHRAATLMEVDQNDGMILINVVDVSS